jgi:lipopolysaccharide transport system permease protein
MKNKIYPDSSGQWDNVINSDYKLFDLKLKELWDYRDLLFLFVRRDFISFYKQTIFGPIWFFAQPVFSMLIYIYVFSNIAGVSTDGLPAPLFYLIGIISWTYFSECVTKTATVFRDNASIFGKVYFPRLIMPLSIILSNFIKLGVQFILLGIVFIYYIVKGYKIGFSAYVLLVPVFILLLAFLGLGIGMIVSSLTNKYRDLALLLTFAVQLLIYATTVVYPLSSVSGNTRMILLLNPTTPIIEGLRLGLLGHGYISAGSFLYVCTITLLVFVSGVLIFNRAEKNFIDTI